MNRTQGLKCKECGERYSDAPLYICEECFGPLEVDNSFNHTNVEKRSNEPFASLVDDKSALKLGGTPLFQAKRLGSELGLKSLYLKDEGASYPSLSFKDRVVSSALKKAIDFGFNIVACASTGNLANTLAARSASAGIQSVIFVPLDTDYNKISQAISCGAIIFEVEGNYDDANRLCSEVQETLGWAVINGNLKPYYLEGVKPLAFEIIDEMRDTPPRSIVLPMGGGGLLSSMWKGLCEMKDLDLISSLPAVFGAQASGSAPIVSAWKNDTNEIRPVKPDTAISSIAIGDPPDGYYAIEAIKKSGGAAMAVPDDEAFKMINLLAEKEGIITGGAGAVALCAAKKLVQLGRIDSSDAIVVVLTDRGQSNLPSNDLEKEKKNIVKVNANLSSFMDIWNQNYSKQSNNDF